MACTRLFLLLSSSMLLFMVGFIDAGLLSQNCDGGNYSTNSSKYLANLDLLFSSLSSNANTGIGFYNTTEGDGSDKSYGLFLCRGDATKETCHTCVVTASKQIKTLCPNTTTAIVWYDDCLLRYSNQSIFSNMQEEPNLILSNVADVSNPDEFNKTVGDLMDRLVLEAASGSATEKYAVGDETFSSFEKVYGLVQCTPDISQNECDRCLRNSIAQIPYCCYPKLGAQVDTPSCIMIYQFNDKFYGGTEDTTVGNGTKSSNVNIIAIVVPTTVAIIILISIIYICFRRRTIAKHKPEDVHEEETLTEESLQFDFETIRAATNNFADANKLGQGGFGGVYKGKLLDGQIVAVKRLSRNSGQGDREFKNEIILVAKLQHRNLVRILGFCLKGEEKLLIYEFIPNTSLDHFIFDPTRRLLLNWEKRYKIIGGIARGLLYLHEDSRLRIIHRDLKASNILLDEEMNPKIGDFGMARLFVVDQTQANTSRIVGTYGYMAPEYMMQGKFSVKTDVFSFGVLLLEIVCGQRNNNFNQSESIEDLLAYAWTKWNDGTALELMDPTLGENCPKSEVIRCIHIGLLCVAANVSDRPTMAFVVLMLNSYSTTLPLPASPAFLMHTRIESGNSSADNGSLSKPGHTRSNSASKLLNEMSITELSPR